MTITVHLENRRFSWEQLLFNKQVLILTLSQRTFLHKENFILSLQLLEKYDKHRNCTAFWALLAKLTELHLQSATVLAWILICMLNGGNPQYQISNPNIYLCLSHFCVYVLMCLCFVRISTVIVTGSRWASALFTSTCFNQRSLPFP